MSMQSHDNARSIIKIVLLTLSFLFSFNALAFIYLQYYNPNKAYALIQHKWNLLQEQPAVDWLILGDSAGNQGVDPSVFVTKKNNTALNLCTIADLLLLNDSWQLEALISQQKKPKNILLIHTYDIWQRASIPTGYASQIPTTPANSSLTKYALSPIKKWLMNLLPLNFQRASLAYTLQHPQTWFQRDYQWEKDGFERIEQADTTEVIRDTRAHLFFVKNNDFQVSTANQAALEALAALARKAGIKVYFAHAPFYEGLYQNEDFKTYFRQVEQYVQGFCQSNSWTYLPDIQTFSTEEMENADHLTATAAKRFTEAIIKQIP